MASKSGKLDAILINGDFVKHGLSLKDGSMDDPNSPRWAKNKKTIELNMRILRENFGSTLLLPTLGNNDGIVHNQMPCTQCVSEQYFSSLFGIFFPEGDDFENVRKTFL